MARFPVVLGEALTSELRSRTSPIMTNNSDDWVELGDGPVLLVVPPFAWLDRPAIGVHLLQALGRRMGVDVRVLYASALFASWVGERVYQSLSTVQFGMFLGERMFYRAAYGGAPLGREGGANLEARIEALREAYARRNLPFNFGMPALIELEAQVQPWLDSFIGEVAQARYRVVGCSSSFEQNASSIAILRTFKRYAPDTITIMGGPNCEGEMADGVYSLTDDVDWVFSGESERSFTAFLEALRRGERPTAPILRGEPCPDLDSLPTPDYSDYYQQLQRQLPRSSIVSGGNCNLSYETSRGCWWGQKSHCTFCGLNGQGMAMRVKSADHVIEELGQLLAAHPTSRVALTDNIMPHEYFRTLVPRLPQELPGLELMYEQKANLSLEQVCALMSAGITEIQPGIEALSTGLLKHMGKGTSAAKNLDLLRFACATGMRVQWNLLYGFPGDEVVFYEETLELLSLLHHLPPPRRANPVLLDRFSPYHSDPARYAIANLRPVAGYEDVVPERADAHKIAYHFQGDFASGALEAPGLIAAIAAQVAAWRDGYFGREPAKLQVSKVADGEYELVDTRGIEGLLEVELIDEAQARAALVTGSSRDLGDDASAWALERSVAVERDR